MLPGDVVTTLSNGWALIAIAAIAVATRYGNAYLSGPDAPDWITGPLALLLAGLGAVAAYFTDVKGIGTWQGALTAFVGALTVTKAVQAGDLGLEPKLKATKAGLSPALPTGSGNGGTPSTVSGPGSSGTAPSVK